MRFFKGFLYAGMACAVLLAVSAPAQAGILVVTDSGGGTVDVHGTAAGADINDFQANVTEINGASVVFPVTLDTLHITDVNGVITGTGTKTIGDVVGQQAILDFTITSGIIFSSHFNMDGVITAVVSNNLPGFDFSSFGGGLGLITLAVDKTGTNFNDILNHPGNDALGSGFGLQESVVPEPGSMALLGIGLSSFFAFRRFFKRLVVA